MRARNRHGWSRRWIARSRRPPSAVSRATHPFESPREIVAKIRGVLQADMQAHERPAAPRLGAAHAIDMRRHDQALIAAPAVAEREAFEGIHERGGLPARAGRRELDAEQAARAEKVALPDRMAGIVGQR